MTAAIWRPHGHHGDSSGQPHTLHKFTVRSISSTLLSWPAMQEPERTSGSEFMVYPVYASSSGFYMSARDSNSALHASTASTR